MCSGGCHGYAADQWLCNRIREEGSGVNFACLDGVGFRTSSLSVSDLAVCFELSTTIGDSFSTMNRLPACQCWQASCSENALLVGQGV